MTAQKVIIDTDPGQDDALAILLALGSPEIDLVGITCVAGNVPLSYTVRNARLVCELAGRTDIPIFAGCDRPMVRKLVTAEAVHGKTGLDGPDWDEPTMPVQDQHAVDWMIETLLASDDGEVTICARSGPVDQRGDGDGARAGDHPERSGEIVTMGGGYFVGGNITPGRRVQRLRRPARSRSGDVPQSGIPITAMPLDVTHKALMQPGVDRLRWRPSVASSASKTAADAVLLRAVRHRAVRRERAGRSTIRPPSRG